MTDSPISNPPVSPEEIKAFHAANPRPVLPPLSEMRNMTPDEREEFDRMSRADVKPIARATALPAKEETPPNLAELVEHAKDVLARGYIDLEEFARALVSLYE